MGCRRRKQYFYDRLSDKFHFKRWSTSFDNLRLANFREWRRCWRWLSPRHDSFLESMREVCLVPTFHREELLFCCLKRIRAADSGIEIHVFPDRRTYHDPLLQYVVKQFDVHTHFVPDHNWYGNTSNTMNAFLWAFYEGYDRVYYVESDVLVHLDFFSWHREVHEMFSDLFASMGWIFNRYAPITNDLLFQNWYYSIGTCFSREKLALIVEHATPKYYGAMDEYIRQAFAGILLNTPFNVNYQEQDGLIQRLLDKDKSQTVCSGIAKCSHMGFVRSYGCHEAKDHYDEILGNGTFEERVAEFESLVNDHYWRADKFGRAMVERELGHELPPRSNKYRVRLPGGWEAPFESELSLKRLPKRILSVTLPADAELVLDS